MSLPLPIAGEPRDLLLGPDNDLVITSDLQFSTGVQAVVQSCRIALQMFAGEWFLDLDAGIPYWESILGQKPDVAIRAAAIAFRSALASVEGVISVLSCQVSYVPATRGLLVAWQVSTALGDTTPDTIALAVSGALT